MAMPIEVEEGRPVWPDPINQRIETIVDQFLSAKGCARLQLVLEYVRLKEDLESFRSQGKPFDPTG